nr:hypothetical protein P5652_01315 [Bacillus subtilis]
MDGPDPRANPLVNETFTVIAEEYGITSVLTGEGGDFMFSGETAVIDSFIRQKRFSDAHRLLREWSDGSLKKMMKYGFQYGVAPFLPYVGEKMYYRLLWSDTEYELPEYFTEEHRMREREINKEDHLQYQKSRDLLYWGKRFHFDFLCNIGQGIWTQLTSRCRRSILSWTAVSSNFHSLYRQSSILTS